MELEKVDMWVDGIDESHVNMAEFYYFENAFTDEEIKMIQATAMKVEPESGTTASSDNPNEGIRKSEIRWLYDAPWLYKRLWTMIEEANRN